VIRDGENRSTKNQFDAAQALQGAAFMMLNAFGIIE
jgi:hypothetical protein